MQTVIARVERGESISYQSYTLIQTTVCVWLGVWPFLCNCFAVFAYRHCTLYSLLRAMNAAHHTGSSYLQGALQWPDRDPSQCTIVTVMTTQRMIFPMIFNIVSLEVSPGLAPPTTLHPVSPLPGIITIRAHLTSLSKSWPHTSSPVFRYISLLL